MLTLYARTIWSTTPHVEHSSNICRTLGCHFDDPTVDLSHLYDNDNSKRSWSEVYAAFEGEWGGRQGCGLDLAPFWYTSPFKLCAPFHLISPLSVGFPRNSFLSRERFVTLACYVRVHSNYKNHFDRIFYCSPTQHVICPVSVRWLSVVVHKSVQITSTFWSLWSHFLLVSNAARYLTRERCVTLIFCA